MNKIKTMKKIAKLIDRYGDCDIRIPPLYNKLLSISVRDYQKNKRYCYKYKYKYFGVLLEYLTAFNIKKLDIQYNELRGADSSIELYFPMFRSTLQKLILYNITVKNINTVLDNLPNLSVIDISSTDNTVISAELLNRMYTLTRVELADLKVEGTIDLSNCTELNMLSLSNCTRYLPILGNCKQLVYLYLDGNIECSFEQLDLAECTKLEYISVDGLQIEGPLPAWITNFKRLRTLEVTNSNIVGGISASILHHFIYPNGPDSLPVSVDLTCTGINTGDISNILSHIHYGDRADISVDDNNLLVSPDYYSDYSEY